MKPTRTRAEARLRAGPARLVGAALLLAVGLSGCAGLLGDRAVMRRDCAPRRLDLAEALYQDARDQLATHFRQRDEIALQRAYHLSQDAESLARSSSGCVDFDAAARQQAINLIRANRLFQKLAISTMPDQDPGVVIGLLGEQYYDIFPR